jgi:hypothetical protein
VWLKDPSTSTWMTRRRSSSGCDLELLSLKELHDIDFGRRRLVQVADELAAMVQDLGFSVLFGVVDEQHVAIFNLTEVVVEDIVHLAGTLRE